MSQNILVYNAWNDIKYLRTLTPEKPLIAHFRPYDDTADPFRNYSGFLDKLLSLSQLYVKFRNQYFIWKLNPGPEGKIPEGESHSTYSSFGIKQYKLTIELIVDTSRNIGAIPLLLTQATLVSPNNTTEDRKLIRYEYQGLNHDALIKAFNDCNQVIRLVAQKKGVDFLDLAEMFSGQRDLFADHVHTTRRGSEEIAKAVASFLANQLNQKM